MRGRYSVENIITPDGIEVISVKAKEYHHSKYDDIITDWRENFSANVWTSEKAKRYKLSQKLKKSLKEVKINLTDWLEDKIIELICFILFEPIEETERRERYYG